MAEGQLLHFERDIQCPYCKYEFRARVDALTPPEPTEGYEVYCPNNRSLLLFTGASLRRVSVPDPNASVAHIEGSRYRFRRENRDRLFSDERDWGSSNDLDRMLRFLWDRVSVRKLRLFACACCRRVWNAMSDERSRRAVAFAEALADGLEQLEARSRIEADANAAWDEALSEGGHRYAAAAAWLALTARAWIARREIPAAPTEAASQVADEARGATTGKEAQDREFRAQADLLRDIVGPMPFRPVNVDPSWLTNNVIALAGAIYDERALDRLPILADALEEAGCTNEDVLKHCRSNGEHVRGCWVVDLMLSKG